MIASIDYLTLMLAGAVVLHEAEAWAGTGEQHDRLFAVVFAAGLFLFIVGTGRALQSAVGVL